MRLISQQNTFIYSFDFAFAGVPATGTPPFFIRFKVKLLCKTRPPRTFDSIVRFRYIFFCICVSKCLLQISRFVFNNDWNVLFKPFMNRAARSSNDRCLHHANWQTKNIKFTFMILLPSFCAVCQCCHLHCHCRCRHLYRHHHYHQ